MVICMGLCGTGMMGIMHGRAWPCKCEKNELEGDLTENR